MQNIGLGGGRIALKDRGYNRFLEKARKRLRENPNADLRDIADEMEQDREQMKIAVRTRILFSWFNEFFHSDYEAAQRVLTKCRTLNPTKQVSLKEATELLMASWQIFKGLFTEDEFDRVMEKLDENIMLSKIDDEDAEY